METEGSMLFVNEPRRLSHDPSAAMLGSDLRRGREFARESERNAWLVEGDAATWVIALRADSPGISSCANVRRLTTQCMHISTHQLRDVVATGTLRIQHPSATNRMTHRASSAAGAEIPPLFRTL